MLIISQMSDRDKERKNFQEWFLRECGFLPTSRTKLLALDRKIRDAEVELALLKQTHMMDLETLERFEQQERAWLAARGLT
jgi:hypothetical protein